MIARAPKMWGLLIFSFTAGFAAASPCTSLAKIVDDWPGGSKYEMKIPITKAVTGGWTIDLELSRTVNTFQVWVANQASSDKKTFRLTNKSWNSNLTAGQNLVVEFLFYFKEEGPDPAVIRVGFNSDQLCSGGTTSATSSIATPTTTTTNTPSTTTTTSTTSSSNVSRCAISTSGSRDCSHIVQLEDSWEGGSKFQLTVPVWADVDGWRLLLDLTSSVTELEVMLARSFTDNMQHFTLTNMDNNKELYFGDDLVIEFKVSFQKSGPPPAVSKVTFKGAVICTGSVTVGKSTTTPITEAPTTPLTSTLANPTTGYNYSEVIHLSLLFYEAQRSGKLPTDNRVPWRGDSALNDGSDVGKNLTGGYFDAGDFVKFGFPMASMTTVLAWGLASYELGYKAAGELENARKAVKWATDYFLKAHTGVNELYGQVGDGDIDHAYWGRPEDMTMKRPSMKIDATCPGSDLAGETAAALAAASIVFKVSDPNYSKLCLKHAKELYTFADTYRGMYHNCITEAAKFYKSYSGYGDELGWAASWLFKATQDSNYLTKAEKQYTEFGLGTRPGEFSWDAKTAGTQVLLAELTQKSIYKQDVKEFCDYMINPIRRTRKGLLWISVSKWGSLRHASNVAFICLRAADLGINSTQYRAFSKQQINYTLGDGGRSYVVGFGKNPPQRPHHASSSCPSPPTKCDWSYFTTSNPNPHVLKGALVGGPDQNDNFQDKRDDYIKNEVTTDYNAGFQSALAGLKYLQVTGKI